MNELLTLTSNVAECGARSSDGDFEFARDSAAVGAATGGRSSQHPTSPPSDALSGSKEAPWITNTFEHLGGPSAVPELESPTIFLSQRESFLDQIRQDIDELKEKVRLSPEAERCRRFATGVGLKLAYMAYVRCAVFGDEEDEVELVAHSRDSMRQVSFEFKPETDSIHIVRIDEKMARSEQTCEIDKVQTLAKAIAWLNPG